MLLRFLSNVARRYLGRAADAPLFARVQELADCMQFRLAETLVRESLDARNDPDAWHLLGLIRLKEGDAQEAVRFIGKSVAAAPDIAIYRGNLALAYQGAGRLGEALEHAACAVALAPEVTEFLLIHAELLLASNQLAEALAQANRLLEIDPQHVRGWHLAANIHSKAERLDEAARCNRNALMIQPDSVAYAISLFYTQELVCDWRYDREGMVRLMERWAADPAAEEFQGVHPLLAWHFPLSESTRARIAQSATDNILAGRRRRSERPISAGDRASARIRIGYLSSDFHNHATMHLMRGVFARHDRNLFEIHAYSLGPDDGSDYRRRAVRDVDAFVDVAGLPSDALAQRIMEDRIDVLVDLLGFMYRGRPDVLAMHPAPVQIGWLGYPATIGRGLDDYMIVDRTVVPPGDEVHYGEKLIWMPDCYQVNDDSQEIDTLIPERCDLGLPNRGFTFACFNANYKIEPSSFDLWMRILARVPESVLWLYRSNRFAEENLRREAGARGADPRRLVFCGAVNKSAHLARLKRADLVLDTHFINAHTGASDALWAGTPLLTVPGTGFPSRVAASVLKAAGLPEFICRDFTHYEERAVHLATVGRPELDRAREHLARDHAKLALFDTARFVRNLEAALRRVVARSRAGMPPESFEVEDA